MKYEPGKDTFVDLSFTLMTELEWTGKIIQTRVNEANLFSDHPKPKLRILHIELASFHQLETKSPQILSLCFILHL